MSIGFECISIDYMNVSKLLIKEYDCYRTYSRFSPYRGYIEAIREIEMQLQQSASSLGFDDIVVACGR